MPRAELIIRVNSAPSAEGAGFVSSLAEGGFPKRPPWIQIGMNIDDHEAKIGRRGSKWKCRYNCLPTQGGVEEAPPNGR